MRDNLEIKSNRLSVRLAKVSHGKRYVDITRARDARRKAAGCWLTEATVVRAGREVECRKEKCVLCELRVTAERTEHTEHAGGSAGMEVGT